jgi:glycosyltransferase involved in cell wall biosynthesis
VQEIKKQAIVIASILKPLDDTRMFEKMAKSLELTGLWSVHIIGFGKMIQSDSVEMYPLGEFSRISWKRFVCPFIVLEKLIRIRPNVVIVNTHELLIPLLIYKIIFGCRAIYDIRENYFLNILYTSAFPKGLKHMIAFWVRLKEWMTGPLIDHFTLAEASYEKELSFIGQRHTIIENKCVVPDQFQRKPNPEKIRLLFTGTIDQTTGVEEAIKLAKQLYELDNRVELRIVGYCARADYREKLLSQWQEMPFISTRGINTLVSHSLIFDEIAKATAGIIFYPNSIHNKDRIPTKVYEYMACDLPIIYDQSATWSELVSNHNAGIKIDFERPNFTEILHQITSIPFYPNPVKITYWGSESQKLIKAVGS